MTVARRIVDAIRGLVGLIGRQLPEPPSDDAERPDIDGRRDPDPSPEDLRRVHLAEKQGKGGTR